VPGGADAGAPGGARDAGVPGGAADAGVADGGNIFAQACATLGARYADVLKVAKQCNSVGGMPVCDDKVPTTPGCSCMTFVDQLHAEGVQVILKNWNDLNCTGSCPTTECANPASATCTQGGCEDVSAP
jgi:hypothetical protein